MKSKGIFASELSTSTHAFVTYHFCRGNSSRRKTRLGIIKKGSGTYIYLSKRLKVKEGDVVFIPENIFCYSEWHGEPEIEVIYVSAFIHYGGFGYEPQRIECENEVKGELLRVSELLSGDYLDTLEAYSVFYKVLRCILPKMEKSAIEFDKTLQSAVEYVTANWNNNFSVGDLARHCLVSESTLYHLFARELGMTPVKFQNSIKINVAIEYLESGQYSVSTISRLVGFNSENHFRKTFFDFTDTTPIKFKKKA